MNACADFIKVHWIEIGLFIMGKERAPKLSSPNSLITRLRIQTFLVNKKGPSKIRYPTVKV
jgi:hypothetical protein